MKYIKTALKWESWLFFVGFMLFFTIHASANENSLQYTIRSEIIKGNGVLVSRPKILDKEVSHIFEANHIDSLEDYARWLKDNIKYRQDSGHDRWADPQETLKRKQGDCEDFTFLTFEVLRGLGYQAYFFALVRKGEAHAICVFKKGAYYMWFDNATLKQTHAKSIRDFAEIVTEEYNYLQLSELNIQTNSWQTLYRRL